jgi:hypothetical protein
MECVLDLAKDVELQLGAGEFISASRVNVALRNQQKQASQLREPPSCFGRDVVGAATIPPVGCEAE